MALDTHDLDQYDEHDPDECELCMENTESVTSDCRCGNCCENLLIETSLRDAEREPRIAAECKTLRDIGPDIIGYLLNRCPSQTTHQDSCHWGAK